MAVVVVNEIPQFQQFRSEKLIPAMKEVGGDDLIAPSVQPDPVHRVITA
jgi:hypothetical protein